jgi:hypothetical protein
LKAGEPYPKSIEEECSIERLRWRRDKYGGIFPLLDWEGMVQNKLDFHEWSALLGTDRMNYYGTEVTKCNTNLRSCYPMNGGEGAIDARVEAFKVLK